jgi:hypothetical protein
MVTLCLIIFSSYGLARFFNLLHTPNKNLSDLKNFFKGFLVRKGMPLVVVTLVCLEFIALPTILIRVEVPGCYRKIKEMQGDFAILELPASFFGHGLMGNLYMFYQTVHGKKIVNGYLSRPSYYSRDFLKEILPKEYATLDSEFKNKLAKNNVKYFTVHELFNRPYELLKIEDKNCYTVTVKEQSSDIKFFQTF